MEDLLNKRIELLEKQQEVSSKGNGIEFERVAKAFAQIGNLVDLLYLEVSVLLDLLAKKGVIVEKEFAELLESTAKKVEESIKQGQEANKDKEESKIIEKL